MTTIGSRWGFDYYMTNSGLKYEGEFPNPQYDRDLLHAFNLYIYHMIPYHVYVVQCELSFVQTGLINFIFL